jgi:membrane protein
MLLVLLAIGGVFYGQDALQRTVFSQLKDFIGNEQAAQIQKMMQKLAIFDEGFTSITIGIITLLIGVSSIFIEIQDSINQIWRVKAVLKKG